MQLSKFKSQSQRQQRVPLASSRSLPSLVSHASISCSANALEIRRQTANELKAGGDANQRLLAGQIGRTSVQFNVNHAQQPPSSAPPSYATWERTSGGTAQVPPPLSSAPPSPVALPQSKGTGREFSVLHPGSSELALPGQCVS